MWLPSWLKNIVGALTAILGVLAFWEGNNWVQRRKGKQDAEADQVEELFEGAKDAKNTLEEIRSSDDGDFIKRVRDAER